MKTKIIMGFQTLVGYVNSPERTGKPSASGNCFGLYDENDIEHKVVNFRAENFEYITKKLGLTDINVECVEDSKLWKIVDDRIPRKWYNEEYCSICCPFKYLSEKQKQERLKELETAQKFDITDDNGKVTGKGYIITQTINRKARKLKDEWQF